MSKSRVLSVGYAKEANLSNYQLSKRYDLISAKENVVEADPTLLQSGVDIGLMTLYIFKAPERRKLLGLREDKSYEIMITFSPVHLHTVREIQDGASIQDVLKAKYAKFFNIDKGTWASGFTYQKMFVKLMPKGSLNIDVSLTEIDNNKVDPDELETLLNDTGIGTVLDLTPVNPKNYIMLASNVVNKIQEVFGSDKAGDDPLWDDTLVLEPNPTIPGSYRLREGFYTIVEGEAQIDFRQIQYYNNRLVRRDKDEVYPANYLVFAVGKSVV